MLAVWSCLHSIAEGSINLVTGANLHRKNSLTITRLCFSFVLTSLNHWGDLVTPLGPQGLVE
jgi:hypothetical protein